MRLVRIVFVVALVGSGLFVDRALAHDEDMITPERLGTLVYGESTFGDATNLFGPPDDRKNIDGCVKTLIAKWDKGLKMFFDREDGQTAFVARVARETFHAPNGSSFTFHTGKGLRVRDTVKKLRRLYPRAKSFRAGDKRRFLLRGKDGGGAYLTATADQGRVIRLVSGFTC